MTVDASALTWAETVLGRPVAGVRSLRAQGSPWLLDLDGGDQPTAVLHTGRPPADLRTQAAALLAAAERGVPAPRLLGQDPSGLLLTTTLPGGSHLSAPPTVPRLRAMGAALRLLSSVRMDPTPELPLRARAIEGEEFVPSPLQRAAEAALAALPPPSGPTVLVHGDLWTGNTMWIGDELTGFIDWDCAGVGHIGLDLGSLRCDAAIQVGRAAERHVLHGWGEPVADLARWDVLAALSTPADLALWIPIIHDQGRTDLDAATANARRDEFLERAMANLAP
ncbi:phosphotransferase [Actinokineospora guangxiensis]|uniref:Phosphotransferase n=1 Tax=Actinokineospora guangxiensis TaxID=1490288 RepID=A0ABW0EF71_9PSEU